MNLGRKYDASPLPQNSVEKALFREIQGWITTTEDIVANLPQITGAAANGGYFEFAANCLTQIAVKLRSYRDTERQQYFQIFKRSERVRKFAEAVLKQIDEAARVFEAYQKKPPTYSKHKSVTTLKAIINHLVNLRDEVLITPKEKK